VTPTGIEPVFQP